MSDTTTVEVEDETRDSPLFGDFDDEVVERVVARHADASATRGEVAFIDRIEDYHPVENLSVDGAVLTSAAERHLADVSRDRDIAVGIELPSGRLSVATFEEPDEAEWGDSRFKQFLDGVGVSAASLEDAIGREVELDSTTDEFLPEYVETVAAEGEQFSIVGRLGFLAVVIGGHIVAGVLLDALVPAAVGAAAWTVAIGLIVWSIHYANTHENAKATVR